MIALSFSAEAIEAAAKQMYEDGGMKWPKGGIQAWIDSAKSMLAAALAHDAERLAQEIIEQRVGTLTVNQLRAISEAGRSDILWFERTGIVRTALLRALTERRT